MAIKVRCKHCRKKISMDEAFAGGVSRCPYCGALNMVPGGEAAGAADRPDRPDAPGATTGAEAAAMAHEEIPVARPVLIQGVVALVLIGLLLAAIIGGGVWYVLQVLDRGSVPPEEANPFTEEGVRIVFVELAAPVVYVVDGSSGTGDALLDVARVCLWRSVLSLGEGNPFNALHVEPEGLRKLADRFTAGGPDGYRKAREFLAGQATYGSTDLDAAVGEAIALSPRSVVVLSGKALKDPGGLAAKAKQAGVAVHCVSLGAYADVTASMKPLSEQTGGQCQAYKDHEVIEWHKRAPPLP